MGDGGMALAQIKKLLNVAREIQDQLQSNP